MAKRQDKLARKCVTHSEKSAMGVTTVTLHVNSKCKCSMSRNCNTSVLCDSATQAAPVSTSDTQRSHIYTLISHSIPACVLSSKACLSLGCSSSPSSEAASQGKEAHLLGLPHHLFASWPVK